MVKCLQPFNPLTAIPFFCFPFPSCTSFLHWISMATEALADVSQGFMDQARFSAQTVEFLCLLTKPCFRVRWMKDGRDLPPSDRTTTDIHDDGMLHSLTISNVDQSDQGIYTFRISSRYRTANIQYQGNTTTENIRKVLLEKGKQRYPSYTFVNQF